MSDFDPDAYLSGDAQTSFDPDAHLDQSSTPQAKEPTGGLDQIGHGLMDTAKGIAGSVGGMADIGRNAYRTLSGDTPVPPGAPGSVKALFSAPFEHAPDVETTVDPKEAIRRGLPKLTDQPAVKRALESDLGRTITQDVLPPLQDAAPVLTGLAGGLKGALAKPFDAQEALNAAASGKSMGAASTAPNISTASPDLQQAISEAARKTGGAVNPDVLQRHLQADSLPEPMALTRGQASQDPSLISAEMNLRGKHPELANRFNQQDQSLKSNLRIIRENAGPDVFTTNSTEHGQTIIDAYKAKAADADANVNAKYQALRDAAGGDFPVSAPKLLSNATEALHDKLLFDHAPPTVMRTLQRLSDNNGMTFENFESLRTNLARIQRSSQDGNERAAAGVIRSAMEDLPLSAGAAKLKPIADEARNAARAQFQALEADPAYKAAAQSDIQPDQFVNKFITGAGASANRNQVATMRQNLAGNDTAQQTMSVAALDHLRDSAGVDAMGNGTFRQSGFNKQLDRMRPKLQDLLAPDHRDQIDTLGNVARYTQAQPRGSFVNNSNTLVGALAAHGAGAAEHAVNAAFKGLPVGSLGRKALEGRSAKKEVEKMIEPGAGLSDLNNP